LFLATKTEAIHLPLKDFVEQMKKVPGMKKLTEDEVLAPEFIITQGLRFAFDVRHPFRALKGAFLELLSLVNLVKGSKAPAWIFGSPETLSRQLLDLPKVDGTSSSRRATPLEFEKRVKAAYEAATTRLESDAVISDAYFLFTPSQIMFASLWLADPPLTEFYLSMKTNLNNTSLGSKPKILMTIKDCAQLLKDHASQSGTLYEEARELDRKLHLCRNPEKLDLVKLNAAQKRDAGEEAKLDESVAKKRKMEREQNAKEAADFFGPDLQKS
jgi:cyclin H